MGCLIWGKWGYRVLFNTPPDFWNNTNVKFMAEGEDESDPELELKLINGPVNATDYGETDIDS